MLEVIPKVKINDVATWVEAPTIAIAAEEWRYYYKKTTEVQYFKSKNVIVLSVMPDEADTNYLDILRTLADKVDFSNFILMTGDCACYNDQPDWCEEELAYLVEENITILENYGDNIQIGLLKGYKPHVYERIRKSLAEHVKYYMLYLSGEIRSNPRWFRVSAFANVTFPNGLDKPVYLHGFPPKQADQISKLPFEVKGIITASHIAEGIYKGNPHYSRKTRITKAWEKREEGFGIDPK